MFQKDTPHQAVSLILLLLFIFVLLQIRSVNFVRPEPSTQAHGPPASWMDREPLCPLQSQNSLESQNILNWIHGFNTLFGPEVGFSNLCMILAF